MIKNIQIALVILAGYRIGFDDTSRRIGTDMSWLGLVLPTGDWVSSLDALANRRVLGLYSMLFI